MFISQLQHINGPEKGPRNQPLNYYFFFGADFLAAGFFAAFLATGFLAVFLVVFVFSAFLGVAFFAGFLVLFFGVAFFVDLGLSDALGLLYPLLSLKRPDIPLLADMLFFSIPLLRAFLMKMFILTRSTLYLAPMYFLILAREEPFFSPKPSMAF